MASAAARPRRLHRLRQRRRLHARVTGCGGVTTPPSVPQNLTGDYVGGNTVQLNWTAPSSNGGSPITKFNIYEDGILIGDVPGDSPGVIIGQVPLGLHDYGVSAVNSVGEGPQAHTTVDASEGPPESLPGKPRIGNATPGKRGGKLTAKISWQPPSATANPAIDGYQVVAYRQNKKGKFVKFSTSACRARTSARSCSRRTRPPAEVRGQGAQRPRLRIAEREVERRPTAIGTSP